MERFSLLVVSWILCGVSKITDPNFVQRDVCVSVWYTVCKLKIMCVCVFLSSPYWAVRRFTHSGFLLRMCARTNEYVLEVHMCILMCVCVCLRICFYVVSMCQNIYWFVYRISFFLFLLVPCVIRICNLLECVWYVCMYIYICECIICVHNVCTRTSFTWALNKQAFGSVVPFDSW